MILALPMVISKEKFSPSSTTQATTPHTGESQVNLPMLLAGLRVSRLIHIM